MRVSVVVPAFNEAQGLGAALRSIRHAMTAFDAVEWDSELIVCDNNSTDRTAEIAREAGAIVAFEPVNQISRARNAGAAKARGDWIIFVDADSHPTRELFVDVIDVIQQGRCLAGAAPSASRLQIVSWPSSGGVGIGSAASPDGQPGRSSSARRQRFGSLRGSVWSCTRGKRSICFAGSSGSRAGGNVPS